MTITYEGRRETTGHGITYIYRATNGSKVAYGFSHMQAFSNLLAVILG
jgi:hypothetical protein